MTGNEAAGCALQPVLLCRNHAFETSRSTHAENKQYSARRPQFNAWPSADRPKYMDGPGPSTGRPRQASGAESMYTGLGMQMQAFASALACVCLFPPPSLPLFVLPVSQMYVCMHVRRWNRKRSAILLFSLGGFEVGHPGGRDMVLDVGIRTIVGYAEVLCRTPALGL